MTDVYHYQTTDDGEIEEINGTITMDDGHRSLLYNALFGGNVDDPGESDTTNEWWGNKIEDDPQRVIRSRTQHLVSTISANSGNMLRVKNAVEFDLKFAVDDGTFKELEVLVTIPRPNRIDITINTDLGQYTLRAPWEAA